MQTLRSWPPGGSLRNVAPRWTASILKAETAIQASSRFEEAIRLATRGELRLAWEAARRTQAECLMGSRDWAEARAVSELLRMEYLAATEGGTT